MSSSQLIGMRKAAEAGDAREVASPIVADAELARSRPNMGRARTG
jgi:hypothetical protein